MRFHVISLPHTQTTKEFSSCAFTQDVRGFCRMMKERGHEVFLYSGEQNDAPCTEQIPCISEWERLAFLDGKHYTQASFDYAHAPAWIKFNETVIKKMRARVQPHDIICPIGGTAHKVIGDAFPGMMVVEFAIGYCATFAQFRVWKSYAWMHASYGAAHPGDPGGIDGQADNLWFDAVIPGYLDMADFPFQAEKGNYFLFVGRLIERKGVRIAMDVCKKLGARLIIAGAGDDIPKEYGEFVGPVGREERGRLMAGAQAVFMPTFFAEPFGMVAIEAMACGTPVITTDWGAFPETVKQGVTGFRCRSFQEFHDAAHLVNKLVPIECRRHVRENYSLDAVGAKYQRYFERLETFWTDGWYHLKG